MESNMQAIYIIVWGQCSSIMQSKIESLDGFKTKSRKCNSIWLLKEIQAITHRFEGTQYVFISLNDAWSAYYAFKQGTHQTLHDCLKQFQLLVQVLERYGAAIRAGKPHQQYVQDAIKQSATKDLTEQTIYA